MKIQAIQTGTMPKKEKGTPQKDNLVLQNEAYGFAKKSMNALTLNTIKSNN
jgi:hypothetical protein